MNKYQELTLDDIGINNEEYANFITIQKLSGGLIKGCFPSCPQVFNERNKKEIEEKFGAGIPKGASCKEMDIEMERIQNEMNMIRGKISSGSKGKYWTSALGALESKMADAKNRYASAKCQDIKLKQEKEVAQKENLDILEKTTKSAISTDPVTELEAKLKEEKDKKPDYTKYIAIGIAGIFVIGAVILLLKPSKAPAPVV